MLVRDDAEYAFLLKAIRLADGPLAVDCETTGLRPYDEDYLTGVSVAGITNGMRWDWYLPTAHPDSHNFPVGDLCVVLRVHPDGLVFHHAPFDWAFIYQCCAVDLRANTVWDTKVVAWLLDENLPTGLKMLADRILGADSSAEQKALKALMAGGKTWATLTAEDIGPYASKDAALTRDLYEWQSEHLDRQVAMGGLDHWPAIRREMDTQRALWLMMRAGIRVDPTAISKAKDAMQGEIEALRDKIPCNPGSPQQVADWLYADGIECHVYTKKGARSTNKAALEALVERGDHRAALLLEYRHLAKATQAYLKPLETFVGADGRVHPWFSSTRTVTGRFSCRAPNLQTIPRGDTMPEVRACFVPSKGMELWEYDLAQAELRVMAGYAGEEAMMDALNQGRDLHSETAAAIFGTNFTPLHRRLAKNLNFGFAYGIGPAKFATYMTPGVPTKAHVQHAREILNGYQRTYPKLVRLMTSLEVYARKHGTLPLHVPGRYRHFRSPGLVVPYYTALNVIVQGGIGEFMKDVMIEWHMPFGGLITAMATLCLQIHDSFVFEIVPGMGPEVGERLQAIADEINPFKMHMVFEAKEWK